MKNRRSLTETLLSSVSPKARLYATCAAAIMILIYGVIMSAILGYLEEAANSFPIQDPVSLAVADFLHGSKFLVPLFFVGIALFVLMAELGRTRKLKSELVPILAQIDFLQRGLYGQKRPMRKNDELQPIMEELHELADQLQRGQSSQTSDGQAPPVFRMSR